MLARKKNKKKKKKEGEERHKRMGKISIRKSNEDS